MSRSRTLVCASCAVAMFAALAAFAACQGASDSKPAPGPGPTPPVTTPLLAAQCDAFVAARVQHCAVDEAAVNVQCRTYVRIAEVADCEPQARRSFECGLKSFGTCTTHACCAASVSMCDDDDTAFDHCLRGYCTAHGGNPDCAYVVGPDAGSGAAVGVDAGP